MNAKNKMSATKVVTTCLIAVLWMGEGQAQVSALGNASNPNPALVGQLTKQLNVTPKQATGGAGAIFGLAKSRLKPADFSKLSAAVPGMSGFLKAAPAPAAGGSALGSLGALVPGSAGGLTSLASQFQSLGLSPAMASKFVPVLQNYVTSTGGSKTAALLTSVLK